MYSKHISKILPSITFTTQLAASLRVPCMQRSGKGLALEWWCRPYNSYITLGYSTQLVYMLYPKSTHLPVSNSKPRSEVCEKRGHFLQFWPNVTIRKLDFCKNSFSAKPDFN